MANDELNEATQNANDLQKETDVHDTSEKEIFNDERT